ncbi:unnamed protein product [Rotaria sp. Silwood1]|nr:unnamed protein product [Rotaria sp. Silwood1]CAF1395242.1 unnamed protein product [Rotaria sp. Silwood1]CAF1396720.1 unnamed protein product [Rotaria sp. Silwood1]CAF3549199.1 unnamed protein product [Rotaria sp. Silwood1]CAF3563795.1 unnamed protein product [Rotaria sp. Silwood1]
MLTTKVTIVILCCLLTSSYCQQPSTCPNQGDGNYGCFDITSQGSCTEVSNQPPSRDLRWPRSGIDLNLDWAIKCGDIIAYKLQWFSGGWSDWYVPGVNDMDTKVNDANGLRRMWSYFYDHNHSYIICKTNDKNKLNGCQ